MRIKKFFILIFSFFIDNKIILELEFLIPYEWVHHRWWHQNLWVWTTHSHKPSIIPYILRMRGSYPRILVLAPGVPTQKDNIKILYLNFFVTSFFSFLPPRPNSWMRMAMLFWQIEWNYLRFWFWCV